MTRISDANTEAAAEAPHCAAKFAPENASMYIAHENTCDSDPCIANACILFSLARTCTSYAVCVRREGEARVCVFVCVCVRARATGATDFSAYSWYWKTRETLYVLIFESVVFRGPTFS